MTTPSDTPATPDAIRRRYADDGYVIFRDVLDAGLIAEADRHVDWLLDEHPELRSDQLHHPLVRDDPFWHRLVADERLVDIAEVFVGSNVALLASHYICKEPGVGRAVPWHQDGAYWSIEPMEVISLWVAVSASTAANGCMRVVPGSHRTELRELRDTHRDEVLDKETPDVDVTGAIAIELAPGDVSVHHPNIVHGSDPNRSAQWRRGLTIRYIPTSTRITDAAAASPFLLRGEPVAGVNEYLPVPRFDPARHMPFRGNGR